MKVKQVLSIVLMLVALMALQANAQFYHEEITFSNVDSSIIVQAGKDTSDAFMLAKNYNVRQQYAQDYPAELNFQVVTTEHNDSTYVTQTLQLSFDKTNWFTHGILDTTTTEDGVTCTKVSSWKSTLWGRLILTGAMAAGDTLYAECDFTKKY